MAFVPNHSAIFCMYPDPLAAEQHYTTNAWEQAVPLLVCCPIS